LHWPAVMRVLLLAALLTVACGGKTTDDELTPDSGATDTGTTADTSPVLDAAPDLRSCTGPGTCSLVPTTCCGSCSQPTTENMTAVTKGREPEHTKLVCGDGPVGCPACAPAIFDGSVQAWCVGTRCTAVDVRKESLSTCATDDDCMLRYQSCCEPCDENPFDLIALNKSQTAQYRSKVCVGDETCSKCLARYPADASAVCDPATKHCRVKSPMLP
jgi:hypothetical protein